MSAERLIASHVRLAAEALSASRLLLGAGNRYAAYQAEQAVEHIILALAQSEGTAFARSQQHQLETMRRGLPEADAFRDDLSTLTWLESFATTYRYPKPSGAIPEPPSLDRLRVAVDDVMLGRVAEHFKVNLEIATNPPALHARPPRR